MFNVPFIIFVKGTAVMPPYVILSVSEVSARFFTAFRMTRVFVRNDRQCHTERQRSICKILHYVLHTIIEKILHYGLHIIIEKILHPVKGFRMTMKCANLHHVTQNDKQGRNRPDLNATARIERAFGLSAFS